MKNREYLSATVLVACGMLGACKTMPELPLGGMTASPPASTAFQGLLNQSGSGEWPRVALTIHAMHPTAF